MPFGSEPSFFQESDQIGTNYWGISLLCLYMATIQSGGVYDV